MEEVATRIAQSYADSIESYATGNREVLKGEILAASSGKLKEKAVATAEDSALKLEEALAAAEEARDACLIDKAKESFITCALGAPRCTHRLKKALFLQLMVLREWALLSDVGTPFSAFSHVEQYNRYIALLVKLFGNESDEPIAIGKTHDFELLELTVHTLHRVLNDPKSPGGQKALADFHLACLQMRLECYALRDLCDANVALNRVIASTDADEQLKLHATYKLAELISEEVIDNWDYDCIEPQQEVKIKHAEKLLMNITRSALSSRELKAFARFQIARLIVRGAKMHGDLYTAALSLKLVLELAVPGSVVQQLSHYHLAHLEIFGGNQIPSSSSSQELSNPSRGIERLAAIQMNSSFGEPFKLKITILIRMVQSAFLIHAPIPAKRVCLDENGFLMRRLFVEAIEVIATSSDVELYGYYVRNNHSIYKRQILQGYVSQAFQRQVEEIAKDIDALPTVFREEDFIDVKTRLNELLGRIRFSAVRSLYDCDSYHTQESNAESTPIKSYSAIFWLCQSYIYLRALYLEKIYCSPTSVEHLGLQVVPTDKPDLQHIGYAPERLLQEGAIRQRERLGLSPAEVESEFLEVVIPFIGNVLHLTQLAATYGAVCARYLTSGDKDKPLKSSFRLPSPLVAHANFQGLERAIIAGEVVGLPLPLKSLLVAAISSSTKPIIYAAESKFHLGGHAKILKLFKLQLSYCHLLKAKMAADRKSRCAIDPDRFQAFTSCARDLFLKSCGNQKYMVLALEVARSGKETHQCNAFSSSTMISALWMESVLYYSTLCSDDSTYSRIELIEEMAGLAPQRESDFEEFLRNFFAFDQANHQLLGPKTFFIVSLLEWFRFIDDDNKAKTFCELVSKLAPKAIWPYLTSAIEHNFIHIRLRKVEKVNINGQFARDVQMLLFSRVDPFPCVISGKDVFAPQQQSVPSAISLKAVDSSFSSALGHSENSASFTEEGGLSLNAVTRKEALAREELKALKHAKRQLRPKQQSSTAAQAVVAREEVGEPAAMFFLTAAAFKIFEKLFQPQACCVDALSKGIFDECSFHNEVIITRAEVKSLITALGGTYSERKGKGSHHKATIPQLDRGDRITFSNDSMSGNGEGAKASGRVMTFANLSRSIGPSSQTATFAKSSDDKLDYYAIRQLRIKLLKLGYTPLTVKRADESAAHSGC
jgi:hypothetical protein